jgi:iron complex outermembrane receptor protein
MNNKGFGHRKRMLAVTLAACLGAPVHAQTSAAGTSTVDVSITAQPLGAALNELARQAGLQLSFAPAQVAGKSANAVSGSMTVQQALDRLLAGSGLVAAVDGTAVVIRQAPSAPVPRSDQVLPEVKVRGAQSPGELPRPYAGGQVARGGQLGILGSKELMDTPFNQSNYTAELLQNQQTRFVADALDNDPSARAPSGPSTGADWFSIRGFDVGNQDVLFNGLPGIAPSFFNSLMAESLERVEVIKGPNALLNGMPQGGSVGGAINVVPKRASAAALTQVTLGHVSDSQWGAHVDLGRRFGAEKEFGVRLNAVYRDGDTPIHRQSRKSQLLALGLDYETARVRLSADLGYQEQDLRGVRGVGWFGLGDGVTAVPGAPDNRINASDPTEFSHPKVTYGMLRGELDLGERWTAFASAGGSERKHLAHGTGRTIVNNQGDLEAGEFWNFSTGMKIVQRAAEAGVRGRFQTGPLKHQAVLAYSTFNSDRRDTPGAPTAIAFPASNIYNPVFGPPTDVSTLQGLDALVRSSEVDLSSVTLADTVSLFDERLQVTLGLRRQQAKITEFDRSSAGAVAGTPYDESRTTPMAAFVLKLRDNVALYGNYIEALQQGPTAPNEAANAGEVFPPAVTKQVELGTKVDLGGFGTTIALYQITRPSGRIDPVNNVFSVDGEQRHRGIDFNAFGELTQGVRLLGGAAYIQSRLTKTEGGEFDGKSATGVPKWRLVLGGEWDTPFVPGLTLTARSVHNASQYVNDANTLTVPAWTRLDLGARYRVSSNVMLRASLFNALDKNYWEASGSFILPNEPRTLSLSATFDF